MELIFHQFKTDVDNCNNVGFIHNKVYNIEPKLKQINITVAQIRFLYSIFQNQMLRICFSYSRENLVKLPHWLNVSKCRNFTH
jgi:hypothetical protein